MAVLLSEPPFFFLFFFTHTISYVASLLSEGVYFLPTRSDILSESDFFYYYLFLTHTIQYHQNDKPATPASTTRQKSHCLFSPVQRQGTITHLHRVSQSVSQSVSQPHFAPTTRRHHSSPPCQSVNQSVSQSVSQPHFAPTSWHQHSSSPRQSSQSVSQPLFAPAPGSNEPAPGIKL